VKWFFKASNQGMAESQAYLGRCYRLGEGVLKDEVEAYAYYNLAGRTNDGARIFRDELEKTLSTEDRKAGLNRAKELAKEIESKKRR
jgi:TPR repeat protein